jgi:uncharacterized protein (DUF2267 family)
MSSTRPSRRPTPRSKEIAEELGVDRREGYRILRGFLHALRDRLTIDESAQLSAQVPMVEVA